MKYIFLLQQEIDEICPLVESYGFSMITTVESNCTLYQVGQIQWQFTPNGPLPLWGGDVHPVPNTSGPAEAMWQGYPMICTSLQAWAAPHVPWCKPSWSRTQHHRVPAVRWVCCVHKYMAYAVHGEPMHWTMPHDTAHAMTKMCLGLHCAELCADLFFHLWTQILQVFS